MVVSEIERVAEARNLGLLMDENLRFEGHVSRVVQSSFYRLKVLYHIRDSLTENRRIQLCESLILSKFNYVDTVIGLRLLGKTKNSIQRVQNACARYCFTVPRRGHVTPYINKALLLKMENRRRLHFATLLFGIVKSGVPVYLFERLRWTRDTNRSHSTRASAYALTPPVFHTAAFRGSFRYAATKCWNDIPPPLRNLQSKNNFRKSYKKVLLKAQLQQ